MNLKFDNCILLVNRFWYPLFLYYFVCLIINFWIMINNHKSLLFITLLDEKFISYHTINQTIHHDVLQDAMTTWHFKSQIFS